MKQCEKVNFFASKANSFWPLNWIESANWARHWNMPIATNSEFGADKYRLKSSTIHSSTFYNYIPILLWISLHKKKNLTGPGKNHTAATNLPDSMYRTHPTTAIILIERDSLDCKPPET